MKDNIKSEIKFKFIFMKYLRSKLHEEMKKQNILLRILK